VSHGEGKFVVSEEMAEELFANGQVAFQYADMEGNATTDAPHNPNGSSYGIEGIISKNGQILGKMGHTERYERDLMKNIHGEKIQDIFANAVNYFMKR
jgi:phosphoribosylformylglycinamidine synthase